MNNYKKAPIISQATVCLTIYLALSLISCKDSAPPVQHKGYYFAITTLDQWGNESKLSNVIYEPRVVESASAGQALSSRSAYLPSVQGTSLLSEAQGGVINIKFRQSMRATLSSSPMGRASRVGEAALVSGIAALDRAAASIQGGVSYQRVFKYIEKHEAKARAHGLDLWYTVNFDGAKVPVARAISAFSGLDQIEIVEGVSSVTLSQSQVRDFVPSGGQKTALNTPNTQNVKATPLNTPNTQATTPTQPFNDPYLERQWHYDNRVGMSEVARNGHINLLRAWKKQTGHPSVIVAIIDSGIDIQHEDLKDAIWTNQGEVPGNGLDDDNNGYIDDIHGWDFARSDGSLSHSDSHGTHVAGTVGATNNNGIGVCGIAGGTGRGDGVRLMNCTILSGPESANKEAISIRYAADNGALIAQCSWGFDKPNLTYKALEDAIDYFIAQAGNALDFPQSPMRGGVVVCAMGNDGMTDQMFFPAAYPQTISVSATNIRGKRPPYSNAGYWVSIAAPGGADPATDANGPGIMSCVRGGYGTMSGTSMAAPHISGIAALLVADNPGITAADLREKIESSGKNTDPTDPDFLEMMGSGCINASKYMALNDGMAPVAVTDLKFQYLSGKYLFTWPVPVDHGEDDITQTRIYYHWEPITPENLSQAQQHTISNDSALSGSTTSLDIALIPGIGIDAQ